MIDSNAFSCCCARAGNAILIVILMKLPPKKLMFEELCSISLKEYSRHSVISVQDFHTWLGGWKSFRNLVSRQNDWQTWTHYCKPQINSNSNLDCLGWWMEWCAEIVLLVDRILGRVPFPELEGTSYLFMNTAKALQNGSSVHIICRTCTRWMKCQFCPSGL